MYPKHPNKKDAAHHLRLALLLEVGVLGVLEAGISLELVLSGAPVTLAGSIWSWG